MIRFTSGTCHQALSPKAFILGNNISGGYRFQGGAFFLEQFLPGILFPRAFFHRHLLYCDKDCQRRRHGLIWEGEFSKRASNPGAVVPGAFGARTVWERLIFLNGLFAWKLYHI